MVRWRRLMFCMFFCVQVLGAEDEWLVVNQISELGRLPQLKESLHRCCVPTRSSDLPVHEMTGQQLPEGWRFGVM